ncbi:hypothetical protein [Ruegeria meonggei]|uniref:hypothetical protein n=1 Tax=Ruegeria meonggei TaxID=1446476 RepID=UPI00366BD171
MAKLGDADSEPELFFEHVLGILSECERYFAEAETGPVLEVLRSPAEGVITAIRGEVEEAVTELAQDSEAGQAMVAGLLLSGTNPLLTSQSSVIAQATKDIDWSKALSTALEWIITGLKKVIEFLGDGKLKTILKDLTILLPQLKTLIDIGPDKVDELTLDVAELEAKVERFLHQVLGKPLVKNEDKKGAGKIPPVDGPVEEPELHGSLLWYLWDIERKLEHLWERVNGGAYPRPGPDELVTDPQGVPIDRGHPIGREIDELRILIECLGKMIGRTLYGVEWKCLGSIPPDPAVPPDGGLHPIQPDGLRHPRAVPPIPIKDEIHNIEGLIWYLIWILGPVTEPPEWPPGWPPPPEVPPENPVILSDLKRILVYEEGVFRAVPGSDEKLIEVRSGAFDLAGWVDLNDLIDGQRVSIELYVLLPGGRRRLYRGRSFDGSADAGLYALQDVLGPIIVVGNAVDIVIRRDSGGGILEVPYQFVTETQRLER